MKNPPRILVTAGPTIEPIDPVRFISNRSTGYMGYELARVARKRGYKVTLISGPTSLAPPGRVRLISVETARELRDKTHEELKKADILVMASAVSDFRPMSFLKNKIKGRKVSLRLIRNPDILKTIAPAARKNKIIAGFALETGNLLRNASLKLRAKKLDLVVANECQRPNTPFGKGLHTVYLLDKYNHRKKLSKVTKTRIASAILDTIKELCYTPN